MAHRRMSPQIARSRSSSRIARTRRGCSAEKSASTSRSTTLKRISRMRIRSRSSTPHYTSHKRSTSRSLRLRSVDQDRTHSRSPSTAHKRYRGRNERRGPDSPDKETSRERRCKRKRRNAHTSRLITDTPEKKTRRRRVSGRKARYRSVSPREQRNRASGDAAAGYSMREHSRHLPPAKESILVSAQIADCKRSEHYPSRGSTKFLSKDVIKGIVVEHEWEADKRGPAYDPRARRASNIEAVECTEAQEEPPGAPPFYPPSFDHGRLHPLDRLYTRVSRRRVLLLWGESTSCVATVG